MEAVKDPVGGNNHALALKIAAEHPGMQPYTNTGGWGGGGGGGGKPFWPSVHPYNENAGNY